MKIAKILFSFVLSCQLNSPQNLSLGKIAPPLPLKPGAIQWVRDSASLKLILESGLENVTVMVADGVYDVPEPINMRKGKNVVIRGASSDPDRAILRGKGFHTGNPGDDMLRIGQVENITIAYLTFTECRSYGIKVEAEHFPKQVHIYNCHFKDIGIRMIKGSTSQE